MKLSEIFLSIQGESTFSGLPCIFIRLAECNLRCNYCDSTYSYQEKFSLAKQEILTKIQEFSPVKLVEITGGEPLLQPEVYELFSLLSAEGYQILLETNGSLSLKNVPAEVHKIVDIKCPDSGEADSFLLENLRYLRPNQDEIKFVLSSKSDYDWMKKQLQNYQIADQQILLSCVFGRVEPADLVAWVLADRLPVRVQLQLHKYIWHPEQQGV
ncbi:MAG: radical SAM protein [Candidatus Cloacimonadales bacterium]